MAWWNPLGGNRPLRLVNFNELSEITQRFFLRSISTDISTSMEEEAHRYSLSPFHYRNINKKEDS